MSASLPVLWASDRVWAFHKPAGLPCFAPHADPSGDCVLARLLEDRPALSQAPFEPRFAGGIAHRLDISTSGQLLVARSVDALSWLRGLFADKRLSKRYRFLTAKTVPWSENTVDRPIAHARRKKRRMVVQRGQNTPHRGKWLPACTTFRRLGTHGRLTLWEARMHSGVMHQIRVHAAFVGLAIVGDRIYGGGERMERAPDGVDFALHHVGLTGPGLQPTPVPPPPWWGLPAELAGVQ